MFVVGQDVPNLRLIERHYFQVCIGLECSALRLRGASRAHPSSCDQKRINSLHAWVTAILSWCFISRHPAATHSYSYLLLLLVAI